jgi:hypothetical protein
LQKKSLLLALAIALSNCGGGGVESVSPAVPDFPSGGASIGTMNAATTTAAVISITGQIVSVYAASKFLMKSKQCGYEDVAMTSSTVIVTNGLALKAGDYAAVSGTGSCATSVAASKVALSSTSSVTRTTGTPASTSGTVLWQAGNAALGKWVVANTHQCGIPVQKGATFTFALSRSQTNCDELPPGRNMANPVGGNSACGSAWCLTSGHTYTWTFHYIDGTPSGQAPGMGEDKYAESGIWQMHDYGSGGGACTNGSLALSFVNSPFGGPQVWAVETAGKFIPIPGSGGAYTPQEQDDWKIVVTVSNGADGYTPSETFYRNGAQVFHSNNPNFGGNCARYAFWDFGIYKWPWELANAEGSTMKQVSATMENMTLTTP